MKGLDIIIPCYNSMYTIRTVVDGILGSTDGVYITRILLVNDNSPDDVWNEIKELCAKYSNIIGINLSRNFGQQSASMAAMTYVEGDYVVFMDDDGQHDANYIPSMINKLEEGYDIVYASFSRKEQAKWKTLGSDFNQLTSEWFDGKPKGIHTSSFFVVRRYIIESLKKYPSPSPVIFGYLMKTTQNITSIPVPHKARLEGRSGYSLKKLVSLWLNAVTSFSIIPLRLSSYLGFLSSLCGIIALMTITIRKFLYPQIPKGYTSLLATLLLLAGILLSMLGLIGEYIGRMFMTINRVPQFVIKEVISTQQTQGEN